MNRKKLELMVESQYFFGIMDKNREKEKERQRKNLEIGGNGIEEYFFWN